MFDDSLYDLIMPSFDTSFDDIVACEPENEDDCKIKVIDHDRGFVFYPSHRKTYYMLKSTDPQLATSFIEDLMSYGTTGEHTSTNPIVLALMENIIPVLDKQYAKYLEYCARDKHNLEYYNHPEDRYQGSYEKLLENAMKGVSL